MTRATPLSTLTILLVIPLCIWGFDLDNSVLGKPSVHCGINNIEVSIQTEKKFGGRLYVQGEASDSNCIRSSSDVIGDVTGPRFEIPIGACNMRRQRTLHPRGVSFSFTLVVSFHPLFVTGGDRAFNVKCFFLESIKSLNTNIDVGILTTEVVEQEFALPSCVYQLRDHDGGSIQFAEVGQKVTHHWSCDHDVSWVYGHLIHSCYADDGHGNKFQLIDDRGCSTDVSLLPQIQYEPSAITAFTHANVFKYADKVQLYFTCTIQLCYKHDGGCDGVTPPVCDGSHAFPIPAGPAVAPLLPNNAPFVHLNGNGNGPSSHPLPPSAFVAPKPDFVPNIPEMGPPKEFIDAQMRMAHKERPFFGPIGGPAQPEDPARSTPFKEIPYKDSPINETSDADDLKGGNDINSSLTREVPSDTKGSSSVMRSVLLERTTLPAPGFNNKPLHVFKVPSLHRGEGVAAIDAATTRTTKMRRDLKTLETDLSVDVIVLPPAIEGEKKRPSNAHLFSSTNANFCVSKIVSGVILAAAASLIVLCSAISYVFARRSAMYTRKIHAVDAYH